MSKSIFRNGKITFYADKNMSVKSFKCLNTSQMKENVGEEALPSPDLFLENKIDFKFVIHFHFGI